MASECRVCGNRDPLPFVCKFCGGIYCTEHRLPEKHDCTGIIGYRERLRDKGKIYEFPESFKVQKEPAYIERLLSVFSGRYSLVLLAVIIISYLFETIPGYAEMMALYPADISARPWTLVTNIFIHGNLFHLFLNMLFLFFFGPELEKRIGTRKFFIVFFLSGIIAALGYVGWSVFVLKSATPAVGASGALYGIFACLAVIAPYIRVYVYFIPMRITYALILFAVIDLLFLGGANLGWMDTVARSAHLTGLAAGLIAGRMLKPKVRQSRLYYQY